MANGHPPLVAPATNSAATSPWFALRYVKNAIPSISPQDLVQLVASVGAETKGHYTFQSVINATKQYEHDGTIPNSPGKPGTSGSWISHVSEVIRAAVNHGKQSWVKGFGYSSKDIPGTGGPSTIQKVATSGAANTVVSGFGDLGKLFSGSNFIGIILIVIILVVVLGRK